MQKQMIKNFTVFSDYLPDDLRQKFLEIGLSNWERKAVQYQPCGKRGYFNINVRYPQYLPQVNHLLREIMQSFGVPEQAYRPARHFIGINLPTAFVTPHTDEPQFVENDSEEVLDWIEVRYNTFLQRPDGGGIPVIDQTPVPLGLGECLAFRADVVHSTTPVEGDTTRVMFSIGSMVNPEFAKFLDRV